MGFIVPGLSGSIGRAIILRWSLIKIGTTLGGALLVVAIDQGVKRLVMGALPLGGSRPLLAGIVDLRYCQNTGAAFSMFRHAPAPAMILLNLLVLGIFIGIIFPYLRSRTGIVAAALVLGGALGNMCDRVLYHHVIDYIDFHFWPVFNIADMAIVIGVGLLIITIFTANRSQTTSTGGACSHETGAI